MTYGLTSERSFFAILKLAISPTYMQNIWPLKIADNVNIYQMNINYGQLLNILSIFSMLKLKAFKRYLNKEIFYSSFHSTRFHMRI